MTVSASPLALLRGFADKRATGEFICATSAAEVHVFLQHGQVAWGTDSSHPLAFAKYLLETARVEEELLREVVEECRRDRLPLGETLVEWGVTTWKVVRAALRHQIAAAVSVLECSPAAQTLFLERPFAKYNEELTFDLAEFLPAVPTRPNPKSSPTEAAAPPTPGLCGLARRFSDTVEGLAWVEVIADGRLEDSDPPGGCTPRTPLAAVDASVGDGADFAAIRSVRGCLIGLALAGARRSVWCQLRADSTFGSAVASLLSMTSGDREYEPAATNTRPECRVGDPGGRVSVEIERFLERAPEVRGAVVLREPRRVPIAAFAAPDVEQTFVSLAQRRLACFDAPLPAASERGSDQLSAAGFNLKALVTGEPTRWCFGAQLAGDTPDTCWLFVDRATTQGLGWAYLSALNRALSRLPAAPAP